MQANTSAHGALVPSLWTGSAGRVAREVVLVLVGTALIAIAAKIKVPFFPVPMTLQTLAIMLIAATYGLRLGTLSVLTYLLEGALGLPVFTNTPPAVAGPAYFLGATGLGAAQAFAGGVIPFLLGDLLKIVVAALAIPAAWSPVGKQD